MKLTLIGAGGVRTPLVIQSLLEHEPSLPLTTVCMMDVDAERLALMQLACRPRLAARAHAFEVEWTTDPRRAIEGSDFVVTAFRVGTMESRVVDEQVPLKYGVLGQETTGPGGFAMAIRTVPVLLEYVRLIRELAPNAWLINFTNPAGMVTEAVSRVAGFERVVGICDNPPTMVRAAAGLLGVPPARLFPEYYGLNHLGWLRALYLDGTDRVPALIEAMKARGARMPGLPFDIRLIEALGAIPNEYLYFYYYPRQSVDNLTRAGRSRALQILPFNQELIAGLGRVRDEEADSAEVEAVYTRYLRQRGETYMTLETGETAHHPRKPSGPIGAAAEGYSGVALGVMGALLSPDAPAVTILNVPNRGAIPGMMDDDIVEVTCFVRDGVIRPFALGSVPDHALGLMKSVKAYERLTIQAAVEGSYSLAVKALALHPLVPSYETAKAILDDYIAQHGRYFPPLR